MLQKILQKKFLDCTNTDETCNLLYFLIKKG